MSFDKSTGLLLVTFPVISRVSVSTPNKTPALYSLSSAVISSAIFVACPTVTIKTPSARGSRVPVCPTLFIPKILLISFTTSNDVIPAGLFTYRIAEKFFRYSSIDHLIFSMIVAGICPT